MGRRARGARRRFRLPYADTLRQLPAQPVAALRILRMVDDPNASTAELARLVEADPALSAKVIKLANSPYYGLTSSVASAARAVILLGFTTVRALAVTACLGLLRDDGLPFPDGFWVHAAATAVGSAAVARRCAVPRSEAFSTGMLHDIGTVLLCADDPERHRTVGQAPEPERLERELFGITHAEVGAAVLREWKFPPVFVRAVADHHRPPTDVADQLTRVVIAGERLAHRLTGEGDGPPLDPAEALEVLGIPASAERSILTEMDAEMDALEQFLEIA